MHSSLGQIRFIINQCSSPPIEKFDIISFLLGGFLSRKDQDAQYFTTDTIEVIFRKAHQNFPLHCMLR